MNININAAIVDQQVSNLVTTQSQFFSDSKDEHASRSAAFVAICVRQRLNLTEEESLGCLTDGGNDVGVDAIYLSDVEDGKFDVYLFQGKYKTSLEANHNFPAGEVDKAVGAVQILFDPKRKVQMNPSLQIRIEETRSLIRDGFIPNVHFFLCNNGLRWNKQGQDLIDEAQRRFGDRIEFVHFCHDDIINLMMAPQRIDDVLRLTGSVIVEDLNWMRVMVGKVSVQEIARLFEAHGDRLLERNVHRYLGQANRVNQDIARTLADPVRSENFYFLNNGITIVCDKFDYNAFQQSDYQLQLTHMQIINGGQTYRTIAETLKSNPRAGINAYAMVRIYQLATDRPSLVDDITYATNSQNPVDLRDLKSNDDRQKQLEIGLKALGYTYKRTRDDTLSGPNVLVNTVVAESVMAVVRGKPHQAKFRRKDLFGVLYEDVFRDLNAAQALLSVLVFRFADSQRKKAEPQAPQFVPYATHYIAMRMGVVLLAEQGLTAEQVSHQNIGGLQNYFEQNKKQLYDRALSDIAHALNAFYGSRDVSLQQLAATFRRGDLLEYLV